MRELVFTLDYEPGCNAVADALAANPDAGIRSLSLHATTESLWRVDHATGDPDALDDIGAAFLDSDYYADCLATDDCDASQTTRVLDHTDDTLVLYSYWERTPSCASVPHIALEQLGEGPLFETDHEGREYTWRIVHSEGDDVRALFDAIEAAVGDCADMEIERLTDASTPGPDATAEPDSLSPEQEAALHAAVEHGYYETPREVDVGELADHLDIPRSTLAYRLRRAEAHLAEQYTAHNPSPQGASTPL